MDRCSNPFACYDLVREDLPMKAPAAARLIRHLVEIFSFYEQKTPFRYQAQDGQFQIILREDLWIKEGDSVLLHLGEEQSLDPRFRLPEQRSGASESPPTTSYVYLSGAILFLSLTGRFPPTTPQEYQEHEADIPSELVDIIRKTTDPDPARRYASFQEMLVAIRMATGRQDPMAETMRNQGQRISKLEQERDEWQQQAKALERRRDGWKQNAKALRSKWKRQLKEQRNQVVNLQQQVESLKSQCGETNPLLLLLRSRPFWRGGIFVLALGWLMVSRVTENFSLPPNLVVEVVLGVWGAYPLLALSGFSWVQRRKKGTWGLNEQPYQTMTWMLGGAVYGLVVSMAITGLVLIRQYSCHFPSLSIIITVAVIPPLGTISGFLSSKVKWEV
jgi:hypothetical protein